MNPPTPIHKITDFRSEWTHLPGDHYILIGYTQDGTRFRRQSTIWPFIAAINAYRGRWYHVRNGKRKLVKQTYNI